MNPADKDNDFTRAERVEVAPVFDVVKDRAEIVGAVSSSLERWPQEARDSERYCR